MKNHEPSLNTKSEKIQERILPGLWLFPIQCEVQVQVERIEQSQTRGSHLVSEYECVPQRRGVGEDRGEKNPCVAKREAEKEPVSPASWINTVTRDSQDAEGYRYRQ
jgi:hypothetical protein